MADSLTDIIGQFTHRSVRDLAWVIASPPLVSGDHEDVHWWSHEDCLAEFNDCLSALQSLDRQPELLITHLSTLKNRRLGSIFEGLVSFWLKISPNYQELYQNIQIIEDKHTYGEIDFIIQELVTGKVIHLEVAVKFYLGCEPYADAYRWFGTNTKDQLGKKIDHLRSHQTQLSSHYPAQLKKYCSHNIDAKHGFVKGRLFYPENSDSSPQNLSLAENHLRGRWIYVNKYKAQTRVIKINKSHWLAELNSIDIRDLDNSFESLVDNSIDNLVDNPVDNPVNNPIDSLVNNSVKMIDRAECFVEIEEKNNSLIEKQRIFYLPDKFVFPA